MDGPMPPTSMTPVRRMSAAPWMAHSAREWNLPSTHSGPRMGMSRLSASHTYDDIECSSIISSNQ